jgi:hypothetical protein
MINYRLFARGGVVVGEGGLVVQGIGQEEGEAGLRVGVDLRDSPR